ncbi:hypothetical protein DUI87_11110 [Hirundo rustica rustica]|uniref:Nuclear mitotic apparatus protein 1 n=1 Tax=Hirundo rustica rustica TaxID=333673 RepID=A0A3M0KXY4_HIRRU|nr:hypothetical protein DUI87_11110 [Hirundo rustica rustica]
MELRFWGPTRFVIKSRLTHTLGHSPLNHAILTILFLRGFFVHEHSRACQQLQAEQEKVAVLEAQAERLAGLQADLSSTQAWAKEKESEEQKLRVEISSLKEKMAVAERTAAQRVAKLEADAQRAAEALEGVSQQLSQEKLKSKELEGTADQLRIAEKELVSLRSAVQEKESWKEQVSQCVQEMERKNSLIGSLEHEVSILRRQVTEKEAESKELKRLILAESEKSKKLEERLRVLQTEMATAASRAAERCSLMKVEVQRCQEEMEKQRMTIEALKRDRHCQSKREDELRQEAKACQDKCLQKEQLLAALQQELDGAQAERASLESQHRRDLEQRAKATSTLQAELAQAKLEAAEVPSLREQLAERDRAVQRLQAEAAEVGTRLAGLQQANAQLAKENQGLSKSRSQGQQQLEAELGQARERHRQELEQLRAASEKLVTSSRQEAKEAVQKLEDLSKEYESSKAAALEERKKLLEAKQRLTAHVGVALPAGGLWVGKPSWKRAVFSLLHTPECTSCSPQGPGVWDTFLGVNGTVPVRKATSSQLEVSVVPSDSEESPLSQQPPQRKPSLESLYFTPILCETPSQLESSANLPGDLSLDSRCKTRSARRRTTINITMTDETLTKLETSSPEKTPSNSGLLGLPGYRPVTRSSLRLQRTSSSSLGRNTINLGMCQDEPEQLDDWNRIAELQRRNQARPPHLKTSYPLESMPSTSLGTITDEDVKMGDPEETLRRASMQPSQLMAASSEAGSQGSSITTRQQRKRLLDETHQGPDTPPSKKPTSCFPRPQTTQDRGEQSGSQVSQESEQPARAMQAQRRQSMAFSILNTPRELGRRLLRRAVAQRSTPTASSSGGGARRSSRIATAKSPKGKAGRQSRKDNRS